MWLFHLGLMKDNTGQTPGCAVDILSESLSLTIKNQVEINFSLTCDFVIYVLWLMFRAKKSTCCKFMWENRLFPVLDLNYSFGTLCTVCNIWLSVHLPVPTPNMMLIHSKKAHCSTIAMRDGGLENWMTSHSKITFHQLMFKSVPQMFWPGL